MALFGNIVAIVTGGSSGLGAATARYLARNGARVVIADLSEPTSELSTLQTLAFCRTDVTIPDQVTLALDQAEGTYGEPVNLAVNCAGMAVAQKTLNSKGQSHDWESFLKVLHVNTAGTFNVARLAAERMSRRDIDENQLRGCIINTASIAGMEGQIGQVAYATSKGAILGMTLPMARDLASQGIRVMTIVRIIIEMTLTVTITHFNIAIGTGII